MDILKTSEIRNAKNQVVHFMKKYGMHYVDTDIEGQLNFNG
jgi:hypothetical protein